MRFPNKAGDHADTDDILRAELKAAGIPTLQEDAGKPPEYLADMLRRNSGEVKTSVIGVLHGWEFKRAWCYWMCSGPGIEIAAAERLQEQHGKSARASGDCGARGPRFWFKGLACGSYHADDAEGLMALADTIRALVTSNAPGQANDAALSDEVAAERDRVRRVVQACCGDSVIERGLLSAIDRGAQWREGPDGEWVEDHEDER